MQCVPGRISVSDERITLNLFWRIYICIYAYAHFNPVMRRFVLFSRNAVARFHTVHLAVRVSKTHLHSLYRSTMSKRTTLFAYI